MKFLADSMLGKLAKSLRILGLDTAYASGTHPLSLLVRARNEGRILLTRNRRLKGRQGVFFVESEKTEAQLTALIKNLPLSSQLNPFSRCLTCNEELRRVSKEEARTRVPFFIYRSQNDFARCEKCGRIYWPGSHLKDMSRRLKPLLNVSRET